MEIDIVTKLRSFSLSKEETIDISLEVSDVKKSKAECEKSLVGKVFGSKKVSFLGFKSTILNIWQTKEAFTIREIGENLFQFVFSSQDDKNRVLNGKNWSFDSQYLVLREWSEKLLDDPKAFNSVDLWIQLWNIPFHWLSVETGRKIGNKFRKLTDITIPESGSCKGRHIKILVEVDLEKPLLRGSNIKLEEEGCWVDFRYENLQNFCFYCGRIGHTDRGCQFRREDLAMNKLEEGQFGNWLRATEFGSNKTGAKTNPKSATGGQKKHPTEEVVGDDKNLAELISTNTIAVESEGPPQVNSQVPIENLDNTKRNSSLPLQSSANIDELRKQKGNAYLKTEVNKENEMAIDLGQQHNISDLHREHRSPLGEIQVPQGNKEVAGELNIKQGRKLMRKNVGNNTSNSYKPMEISMEEPILNAGKKRNFMLIDEGNSEKVENHKKAKGIVMKEELKLSNEKVEVASLNWAQSYQ